MNIQVRRSRCIRSVIARYQVADNSSAAINLGLTLVFYFTATALVIFGLAAGRAPFQLPLLIIGYMALGMAIVKIFSIQHDCGHDSYFKSSGLNRFVGRICSVVTLLPFTAWREEHNEHHACFARIDQQTYGDIKLLTVEEFRRSVAWRRFAYRIFRSPLFLFGIAPLGYVFLRQRVPSKFQAERVLSCISHTAAIVVAYGLLLYLFGLTVLVVVVPSLYVASSMGIAFFVVEHQFEEAEWFDTRNWDFDRTAVSSSSYISMPPLLEWITGYFGYHHLHHFSPRDPIL